MAATRKQPAKRGGKSTSKGKSTAVAARAEANGDAADKKTAMFGNLELELPENLPETILFDITDIEAGVEMEDPRPIFRLLRSIVGPEQFTAICNKIEADQLSVGDEVMDLMGKVLSEYGLTTGESSASSES